MSPDTVIKIYPSRDYVIFDSPGGLTDESILEATKVALRLLNARRKEFTEKVKSSKKGALIKEWESLSREDKEMVISVRDTFLPSIPEESHKLCEAYGFIYFNGRSNKWMVTEKYRNLENLLMLGG